MSRFPLVDRHVAPSARPLVATALIAGMVMSAGIVLFIGGEMLTDPGGWTGAGLVAAWLVLPVVVAVVALLRPAWGLVIAAGCVGLLVLASVASWFASDEIAAFEDSHGPVLLIAGIAVWLPLIALGRSRPLAAGILLFAATLLPIVLQAGVLVVQGAGMVIVSLMIVSTPFVLLGMLLVAAGIVDTQARRRLDAGSVNT